MIRLRTFAGIAAMALLLSGCILVEKFGAAWDEAKPDMCLSKIAESLYYAEFRRDPTGKDFEKLARGISHNGQNYLLLKQSAEDEGGRLYRFQVTNGIFQRFRLDPTLRATFKKEYPNAPVEVKEDTVKFASLGEVEWKLLDEIAAKPEYWEIEDQTLYNTIRNPLCRFEDRDLSKED